MRLRRSTSAAKFAAAALGLALVAAAVVFALRGLGRGGESGASLGRILAAANPWWVAALAVAIAAHLTLTGLLFWQVTRSFDADPPVGPWRMIEIIAASSLLNYLPLEAGLVGRSAYLKAYHALPVRQSVLILLAVIALSTVVPLGAVAVVVAAPARWQAAVAAAAVVAAAAATGPTAAALLRRRVRQGWSWVPLRVAEMLVGAGRLSLAFAIIGSPAGFKQVLLAAAAGFLVTLLSPTPNGLGLREWAITALSEWLSPASGPAGALASLVDRAVEGAVFSSLGLWALWRLRAHAAATPPSLPASAASP